MATDPCAMAIPWLGRAGCSVCLAGGRKHSLPWQCPLRAEEDVTCAVCWTSAGAALTRGKLRLCRILLLLSDAAFTAEPLLSALGEGMGCFSSSPPAWPAPAGTAVSSFPSPRRSAARHHCWQRQSACQISALLPSRGEVL